MKVRNLGEKDGWARLDVLVESEELSEAITFTYMAIGMQLGISPKKGVSAAELLGETMGQKAFSDRVNESLMRRFSPKAYDEAGVDVMGEPVYQYVAPYEPGKPFEFRLLGALIPKLELSSYGPVVINEEMPVVPEEEVGVQLRDFLDSIGKERQAPASPEDLTDEWVSSYFKDVKTVEDLRNMIYEKLEQRNEVRFKEYLNFMAAAQLSDRLEGEIPDVAFQVALNETEFEFEKAMAEQHATRAEYCKMNEISEEELKQQFLMRTQARLRQEFALDAVARHEHLELSEEDFKVFCKNYSEQSASDMEHFLQTQGGLRKMRMQALRLKANSWAVEHAVKE